MALATHLLVFVLSISIVWFFAGMIIESVGRIARRFCKTGFITAFFILGTLTSISELSVAIHATATGVPDVSVGNVIGGSFVLLLGIVPILAIVGKGVSLNEAVSRRNVLFVLAAIALPVILVLDGEVTRTEGLLAVLSYTAIGYMLYRGRAHINACDVREEAILYGLKALLSDFGRVIVGSIAILAAAYILVDQSVFFASVLGVAPAFVGLIILSIGTNIPETAIALRSIMRGNMDIAFGNYLGSAMANTFIFGLVGIANGTFLIATKSFISTAVLMVSGFVLLYIFMRRRHFLTPKAASVLLLFYGAFLVLQLATVL